MKMEAAVRDNQTKETFMVKSDYASKKQFREDLNRNGYTIIGRVMVDGVKTEADRLYDMGCK